MNDDDFHDSITVAGWSSSCAISMFPIFIIFFFSTNLLFKIKMIYNDNDHLNSLHPTSTYPTTANGHLDAHIDSESRKTGQLQMETTEMEGEVDG